VEHRYGERLSITLDVLLKRQGKPVLRGRVRNIGLGGVLIRMESGVLMERKMVDIELPLDSASNDGCCRVKGWVVHSSDAGVGLLFRSLTQENYQRLRQFIQQQSAATENKEV